MSEDRRPPSERIHDVDAMTKALRKAVRLALLQHKRAGNPVAVWRDGAVAWIPAAEIPVGDDEDAPER